MRATPDDRHEIEDAVLVALGDQAADLGGQLRELATLSVEVTETLVENARMLAELATGEAQVAAWLASAELDPALPDVFERARARAAEHGVSFERYVAAALRAYERRAPLRDEVRRPQLRAVDEGEGLRADSRALRAENRVAVKRARELQTRASELRRAHEAAPEPGDAPD